MEPGECSMTTILHLVRHGEAVWNAEGKYQGQADSGLTAAGREQAARAALWLRALPRVDGVACSDLPRVRDTAAPFLDATGHDARVDPRLREIDVGSWPGAPSRTWHVPNRTSWPQW